MLKIRVHNLAVHLHAVALTTANDIPVETLDQAVACCEGALPPLQQLPRDISSLEAQLERADRSLSKLADSTDRLCRQNSHCSTATASTAASHWSSSPLLPASDASLQVCDAVFQVCERTLKLNTSSGGVKLADHCENLAGKEDSPTKVWEPDRDDCSICGTAFGPRLLGTRHHCRTCGRCICSSCSSSSVKITGESAMQRVCAVCVTVAQEAHALRLRMVQLSEALTDSINENISEKPGDASNLSLSDVFVSFCAALDCCERCVIPLEAMRNRHTGLQLIQKERAAAEAEKARLEKGRWKVSKLLSGKSSQEVLAGPLRETLRSWDENDDVYAEDFSQPSRMKCLRRCSLM